MTPCFICASPIEDVKLDPRDMKTRPCSHCESIIQETAALPMEDDDLEHFGFDDEEFPEDDNFYLVFGDHGLEEDY